MNAHTHVWYGPMLTKPMQAQSMDKSSLEICLFPVIFACGPSVNAARVGEVYTDDFRRSSGHGKIISARRLTIDCATHSQGIIGSHMYEFRSRFDWVHSVVLEF